MPDPSNMAGDPLDGLITVEGEVLPTVESVVADGSGRRSRVSSLTVTFSTVVNFLGDPARAFLLAGPLGRVRVAVSTSLDESGTRTVARLTFPGRGGAVGSLLAGRYRLTIDGDQIVDVLGQAVDGDGDGLAGGDAVERFFRRYGESDGDAAAADSDLAGFLVARGRRGGGGPSGVP
jgi:hypothetical protein